MRYIEAGAAAVVAAVAGMSFTTSARPGRVERGRYLVTATACNDCHSSKETGADGRPVLPPAARPADAGRR